MLPLIGPSMTQGAVIASWRKVAMKVIVFQCPKGALPISRLPRAAQPRNGVMLVLPKSHQ